LKSVGIDIGTTSCHLVFSRLELANQASSTQIPKLTITERTVLFESAVHITPLKEDGTIDGAGVAEILRSEYSNSGFKPADINCGAVIITGETAMLRNAEEVLQEISALAGDFVAASAGPELESILAGRGSGALQYSRDYFKTICNIDIGGGTTNIAVFRNGELVETACLRIGGRCLRFTKTGTLTHISTSGERLMELSKIESKTLSEDNLSLFASDVSRLIVDFVTGAQNAKLEPLLMSAPLSSEAEIDEYWLSGGIAELMQNTNHEKFEYEDFGWFLADGLKRTLREKSITYRIADNPLRATVLGAGSFSLQLSGNTVSVSTSKLPIKGVPLIRPFHDLPDIENCQTDEIATRLRRSVSIYDKDLAGSLAAIILDLPETPRFKSLKAWAEALARALEQTELAVPYILIAGSDSAMALGQLLRGCLTQKDVVVLDGIDLSTGDYIDIGKPLPGGTTIPVTVKSLVFAAD